VFLYIASAIIVFFLIKNAPIIEDMD